MLAALLLFTPSCFRAGPNYSPPSPFLPAQFQQAGRQDVKSGLSDITHWWTVFGDPSLEHCIEQAGAQNLSLRTAQARIEEARANLAIAAGDWFPLGAADGQITRAKQFPAITDPTVRTRSAVGFSLSWELDLFGRVSRAVESASAAYEASAEDRTALLVSLYAETARIYFTLRQLQAQLESAKSNIAAQREILQLTQSRFASGLSSGLDVAQAERILASSEAELPNLRIGIVQALNNLAVLLGKHPGGLHQELSTPRPVPAPPASIVLDIPASVIRRRPDVRAAERRLAAQAAQVGIAASALYPAFSLDGSFSYHTISPNGERDISWSTGPFFSWPLLDFARIRAQVRAEEARAKQALLGYEQTVLDALREAENALAEYAEQQTKVAALERSAAAAQNTLKLSTQLYADGLADFENVLDAERSVFVTDSALEQAKGELAVSLAFLYKAFGGGWGAAETPTAPANENWKTPSSIIGGLRR